MEYLNHLYYISLKCDHPFLCKFPFLFSTEKLELGHNISQFIHRFKILKWWSWAEYTSKFFPFYKRDGKLRFLKSLGSLPNFSQLIKEFESEDSLSVRHVA